MNCLNIMQILFINKENQITIGLRNISIKEEFFKLDGNINDNDDNYNGK